MNLKSYYTKIHEVEATLADESVLVVSEATPDGGKPGVMTLAAKRVAAQLVVEGKARVASEDEKAEWELAEEERRENARREEMAQRIQVQVIADPEPARKPRQNYREDKMALLVDGGLTTVATLKEHDTGVLETATGEGIDLAGKLRLAENELRADVERFLARVGRGAIGQVTVSESMMLWHAWKTLEAVYRDAYFSQLNDRYYARWKHYRAICGEQRQAVLEEGIGLVAQPLRRPAKPNVAVESGTMAAGVYRIAASVLNGSGEESAPSEAQTVTAGPGSSLRVTLDWLPVGATGWLVYAATAEGALGLQTTGAIEPTGAYLLTAEPQPGRPPAEGQAVREWVLRSRRLG